MVLAPGVVRILSSDWTGLSPHLIASFYQVDKDGNPVKDSPIVKAPLTESNLDVSLGWQSPFEQMSPESKAPTLFAMLQSGALEPFVNAISSGKGAGTAQQKGSEFIKQFEGRTGITKLNSVQVFSGMPPIKIQVTALFRAWLNPAVEVEEPINQLMKWALPQELSENSTLFSRAVEAFKNGDGNALDVLLPSKSPIYIGIFYKNRNYAPMVIESIGLPLNSPINANGEFVEIAVPMTICSLSAIDREDWVKISSNNK